MRKVFTFIFLVLVVSLSLPIMVHAKQLVTSTSAIGIALYEQLKNDGYELSVPFDDNALFDDVMKPLVNAVLSWNEAIVDEYVYVGERLYYDVDKVRGWIKRLFGDGDTGSYNPNPSSVSVNIDNYNSTLIRTNSIYPYDSKWVSFGSDYDYPVLAYQEIGGRDYEYVYTFQKIPLVCQLGTPVLGLKVVRNYRYIAFLNSYLVTYTLPSTFYYKIPGSSEWFSSSVNPVYFPTIVSPSAGLSLNAFQYSVIINNTVLNDALSLADTTFLNSCRGLEIYINDVAPPPGSNFTINRTSEPIVNQPLYQPINYNYVTNNYGSADTIYNQNINNNIGGGSHVDQQAIINAIHHVDSSVLTGSAAIVQAINNLSLNQEYNNDISNNYDFNFGDLNITGSVNNALPSIGEGFEVVTGSSISTIGSIIHIIPSEWLILAFACLGAGLIISVFNKVSGG